MSLELIAGAITFGAAKLGWWLFRRHRARRAAIRHTILGRIRA